MSHVEISILVNAIKIRISAREKNKPKKCLSKNVLQKFYTALLQLISVFKVIWMIKQQDLRLAWEKIAFKLKFFQEDWLNKK